jgi:hypothetical protein
MYGYPGLLSFGAQAVTLHESKHSGYTDLSRHVRLHQAEPPGPALHRYADLGTGDCFGPLARLAEPEPWGDGILRDYVEQTFERLSRSGQIAVSADNAFSAFNTGLATPQQEAIYGLFVRNQVPGAQPWLLSGWLPDGDRALLDRFPEPPSPPVYADSPAEYVYDGRRELVVLPKQLLATPENLAVLPGPLGSNPYQAGLVLEGAVRRVQTKVRRYHRAAVPGWDPATERLQLLLPLALTTPDTVDVALAVVPDGEAAYRGVAVLSLDRAYARARLVGRPQEWLP